MLYVHLAEGFEEIEAITVLDILRRAKIEAEFVSMGSSKLVTGAHGILVKADITFDEADYAFCRMIILPGGMPGTKHLAEHKGLAEKINEFVSQDKYLAAICAAPMVFGAAGILDGKKATIYPGMEEYIKNSNQVSDEVVVDGNIITSRGPGTAIEFALVIVEIFKGEAVSKQLRKDLVINGK